jgi:hypothetical protein
MVRQMRVRAPARLRRFSEPRTRAAVERADVVPAGLPRSAVLCIRRVSISEPRASTSARRTRWDESARAAIEALVSRAVRPARGFVPAGAEAVLFLDRSELLAALAHDWCEGRVGVCWWWRAMFPSGAVAATVLRTWHDAPEHIAAAVHIAAAWGTVVPFISRLHDAEARALTARLAWRFGVGLAPCDAATLRTAAATPIPQYVVGTAPALRESAPAPLSAVDDEVTSTAAAALMQWAPEIADAPLTSDQRLLAYAALVLHRAPAQVRPELVSSRLLTAVRQVGISRTTSMAPQQGTTDVDPTSSIDRPESPASAGVQASVAADGGSRSLESRDARAAIEADPIAMPPQLDAADVVVARVPPRIATAFGGAFYLINVAIALGLFADFTRPADRGPGIGLWDFLRLLTREFVRPDEFDADPIAMVFVDLAGGRDDYRQRWVGRIARIVSRRLTRSLDMCASDAASFVVRRDAGVVVSAAHVEVTFALESLSVAIRRAGLDRNPGFVPAASRSIGFVYE